MNIKGISIILCFYNAEKRLTDTISYLKKLNTNGIDGIELIFVDNNSNDNSCKIINNLLKNFDGFPWKIVKEEKIGLSNARLKGISESKYDILLFCDDDNWLSENYLITGINILNNNPCVAVLGGKGIAKSTIELPDWFEEIQAYYATGEQMPYFYRMDLKVTAVYGAGMFVRKDAFLDIFKKGFHFFNLGRTGKNLSAGEDTEMCLAFHIAGYKILYDSGLEFFHFIEAHKLNLKYLEKIKMGITCSRFISRFYLDYIYGYTPGVGNLFWLKEFVFSLKDLILSLFKKNNTFWIKRNLNFSKYLLQQRFRYNENVKKIIAICKSLENR